MFSQHFAIRVLPVPWHPRRTTRMGFFVLHGLLQACQELVNLGLPARYVGRDEHLPQDIRIRHNRSFLYHTQEALPIRFKKFPTTGVLNMRIK
ncbi:MAG: hypothetical protein ACTSQ8_25010 [Candidatus Helarchaeota archaeon]